MAKRGMDAATEWVDRDDAPELSDAWFDAAGHPVGGMVIGPATGEVAKGGVRCFRSPDTAWLKSKSPYVSALM